MKIKNQNIFGGQQQFADHIFNIGGFNSAEQQLITASKNDKELIQHLSILKSKEASEDKKSKSGNYIKKFLESSVGEAGKSIMKELIENGVEYLNYIL